MASQPAEHDVRLRKVLTDDLPDPLWPGGLELRCFRASDAPALHDLLVTVFDDGSDGPFDSWWARLRADPEFEPGLCLLAFEDAVDADPLLVGAVLAWNTAFIKDLAVRACARRRGLGRALAVSIFQEFRRRGMPHVDLKTNLVGNADAVRLYRSLGMTEVAWEG